ncbi:DnaJ domain-containing protein [bacterium]|nr:DnaJ domain-containing protein [bacterium]
MVFNGVKNYYELLNVDSDASTSEIKSAYRKLARIYHPDVNKDTDAIDKFKEITSAYETLCNGLERQKYDTIHHIFRKDKTFEFEYQKQETKQEQDENLTKEQNKPHDDKTEKQTRPNKNPKSKEKNNKKSFSINILKTVKHYISRLKRNKKIKDFSKPQKGENLTTEITITPDEVLTGSKRIINIRSTKTCPKCFGHKFTNGDKCSNCGGSGTVTETKKITLTIPKGIKDGTRLRLKGEGASGKNGGSNGDVYVLVHIETKTQVHFDKLNIYYNVPITPFEAALGEEISIPAFDGTIKLKLPKNTRSGQKFRIAKQGLKKNGKIGDLIVTVSIEISHNLSDDEIKLYEQLKNLSSEDVRKNFGYGS